MSRGERKKLVWTNRKRETKSWWRWSLIQRTKVSVHRSSWWGFGDRSASVDGPRPKRTISLGATCWKQVLPPLWVNSAIIHWINITDPGEIRSLNNKFTAPTQYAWFFMVSSSITQLLLNQVYWNHVHAILLVIQLPSCLIYSLLGEFITLLDIS